MVAATLDNRPREEHDFKDFYSDLDESSSIRVLVNLVKPEKRAPSSQKTKQTKEKKGVTSLGKIKSVSPLKITKPLAEYGFRENPPRLRRVKSTYVREISKQGNIAAVYDMDEQDDAWLEWLNEELTAAKVLPEAFEVAMSVLEAKWVSLEAKMERVSPGGIHESTGILTLRADYDRYGSDDGTGGVGTLTDQRCAVCNDLECENSNAIVFCDGCNIAVHQECYGIAFIPEGHWYCRRCMVSRGTPVSCTFCPSKTGAFKQLDNGLWSHVVCALWINEVYFANPIYMEPIEGIDLIPKNRWRLICYICKQRTGACIQCSNRNCFLAYHVTCAKRAGSYMAMEKGLLGALASKATLKSYCDKHSPSEWSRENSIKGIAQTRRFYRDNQLLNQQNDRLAFKRQQQNRENTFKWKTEAGTPIAPQLFADELVPILKRLNCDVTGPQQRTLRGHAQELDSFLPLAKDLKYACAVICRYWCLKREAKRGAPLVRFGASNLGSGNAIGLDIVSATDISDPRQKLQNISFGLLLQKDLRLLISLCNLTKQRQWLLKKQSEQEYSSVDLAYFSVSTVAFKLLKKHKIVSGLNNLLQKLFPDRDSRTTSFLITGDLEEATETTETTKTHDSLKKSGFEIQDLYEQLAMFKLRTSQEIDTKFRKIMDGIINTDASPKSLQKFVMKCLSIWKLDILPAMILAETRGRKFPFVEIDGITMEFKQPNASKLLAEEDLSEVEEDPFKDPKAEQQLKEFLKKQ